MQTYKTITVFYDRIEYRFEVELIQAVCYDVSRLIGDTWDRCNMNDVPERAQILYHNKLRKLRVDLQKKQTPIT